MRGRDELRASPAETYILINNTHLDTRKHFSLTSFGAWYILGINILIAGVSLPVLVVKYPSLRA